MVVCTVAPNAPLTGFALCPTDELGGVTVEPVREGHKSGLEMLNASQKTTLIGK